MAKQFIISAMEETLGEYILNISKDNLKIAALRGQLKLENVQLDGDLVGSHVLGAVGLSSFGVLSCSAKLIRVSIPWKNIEKEPTRFEIRGVHLVCVPLTPSTANQMYGAGSLLDPRCSLRTRAKRLVLARFERNFWNGLIPGEGPVMKRIQRAVKEVERDRKRSNSKTRKREKSQCTTNMDESDMEEIINNLVQTLGDNSNSSVDNSTELDETSFYSTDDLPELPRDWKVKLREKILRNIEASFHDIHIRLEVPEHGLEFASEQKEASIRTKNPEDQAFVLGFTLESLVIRTANSKWEVGSHEKRNHVIDSELHTEKDHLGPNEYVAYNNKIGYFNNLSIYWDDNPPILLCETDVLQGNYRKLSAEKIQARVVAAMEALFQNQDPGAAIRQSLSARTPSETSSHENIPHFYICESLDAEVRARTSDRFLPGPISCSADVLPFNFTFNIRPSQYLQYQKLKAAVKSQQRFDTMPRQRPFETPLENPHAWWKYAIMCVTSRPNSRSWQDIKKIGESRQRYIALVMKNNSDRGVGVGYHAGLSSKLSEELLGMEDCLPIEALLAFHLVALRRVHASQSRSGLRQSLGLDGRNNTNRFRILRASGGTNKIKPSSSLFDAKNDEQLIPSTTTVADNGTAISQISLLEAMTLRLGKKVWFVDWKLRDATVCAQIWRASADAPMLQFTLRASGNLKSFGFGKRDFSFSLSRCDITHGYEKVLFFSSVETVDFDEDNELQESNTFFGLSESVDDSDCKETISSTTLTEHSKSLRGPDLKTPSNYLDLPLDGACRIVAGKNQDTFKLSISAHPATLVWTTTLSDSLSELFSEKASDLNKNLTRHIRNFATPMARKAQLALLSPASFSLYLNIAAPKIWIPLISGTGEGCLILDAGTFRLATLKNEGETEFQWNVDARDIGSKFVRGFKLSTLDTQHESSFGKMGAIPVGRGESVVVKPFSVEASSKILKGSLSDDVTLLTDSIRNVDVGISPICLNLVDVEMIARLLGKLYSQGLHRVRRESPQRCESNNLPKTEFQLPFQDVKWSDLPRVLTLQIDKIEIALEGRSKQLTISDDRSTASLDTTLQEYAPSTRVYLVEIFQVILKKSSLRHTEMTRLSIMDASIVRLSDVSLYVPLDVCRKDIEPENYIFLRNADKFKFNTFPSSPVGKTVENEVAFNSTPSQSGIFRASVLHNRLAYTYEVEIDIDSVVLKITPTTLKDCAKAFRRIMELAHLMTKEMERKVHEEGRNARRRTTIARDGESSQMGSITASNIDRPGSPAFSEAMTDFTAVEMNAVLNGFDSSIHFRVTLKESVLLIGKPVVTLQTLSPGHRTISFAVVQILSNALIMFQSIENPDATGTKTLHISVDNVSALVNTEFECICPSQASLILEPLGAEFRIVYSTENFGCIVSQDVSFNYDAIRSCLTTNDASVIFNISRTMFERLKNFGFAQGDEKSNGSKGLLSSLMRYQKKGTGVATRIRIEIHTLSFVLLRAYKSYFGAPELLDVNIKHVKGIFEGCMSALSGDLSCVMAIATFNSNLSHWEYAVEPCSVHVGMEQMPNELVLNISPSGPLQINLGGFFLCDFAEIVFDMGRRPRVQSIGIAPLEPSILSTVGQRRATEARSVTIVNLTGLDIQVVPTSVGFSPESPVFTSNAKKVLDVTSIGGVVHDDLTISLRLAPSSEEIVGDRHPIDSLPIKSTIDQPQIFHLYPCKSSTLQPGHAELLRLLNGRSSPESMLSEIPVVDTVFYNAEPVVEWCMQNQRLRPSIVDVFSLQKGQDLLSSTIWSPEDGIVENDLMWECEQNSFIGAIVGNGPEAAAGEDPSTLESSMKNATGNGLAKGNWLRPYLKNDSPEWSDMTCMLSIARERVLLPDSRWIWLNNWNVDVSGRLGDETDADGWSYEADFETFTKTKRHYKRGDVCRRRRWTRTRMFQPPPFNDPLRQLTFLWETTKDENGCFSVTVRSNVRIKNKTSSNLTFFANTPSWDEDKVVATTTAGEEAYVPVVLSSAVFLRIGVGKKASSQNVPSISDFALSDRFSIVPVSHTSSSVTRARVYLDDVSGTVFHFIVELRSDKGVVDVIVEPVFRIINLLPCQLECVAGHINNSHFDARIQVSKLRSNRIIKAEAFTIKSGAECSCIAVNPWRKPHISLRVPGYKWSSWKKVVNRKNDNSWRPSDSEEENSFDSKGDAQFGEETKTVVKFERINKLGNPLILVVSVACGHCPVISVYSQYLIIDKTGFGCHFSEGFIDILGTIPDPATSRRSYLITEEGKDPEVAADMLIQGHQWSMGCSGMSMYFSQHEKLTLSIESGEDMSSVPKKTRSKWISPLDISNVIPKTVFYVDELNGSKRFELAIHVSICPGQFGRTKLISLLPRYLIFNLLHRELVVAQDGCLEHQLVIPSQSSSSFHWENGNMPPKVRLGAPSAEERARDSYERCWTNGRFQIDRIGITSLRLPTTNTLVKLPMVVQAEVRLASKDQASAVVVVVWSGNDKSNPLYTLRNRTRHVILCRQPLQDDEYEMTGPNRGYYNEYCSDRQTSSSIFECGTDIGPILRTFLSSDRVEEFVWILKPGDVTCFGFDDPEKPHILEWTYVIDKKDHFNKKSRKAFLEVDAMGSCSSLPFPDGSSINCQIIAEYSTKVVEFLEIGPEGRPIEPLAGTISKLALRKHGLRFQELLGSENYDIKENVDTNLDDDDTVAFSLKVHIPILSISVIDNFDPTAHGREILLAQAEGAFIAFSQTNEGYHNFEIRLMTLQVDNHILKSVHPVLIFCPRVDDREPLLHISAVRRLQRHSNTFVFRYAAIRLLEVEIFLDRRTTETIAKFVQPFLLLHDEAREDSLEWISSLTMKMARNFTRPDRRCVRDLDNMTLTANSGRIYFEHLHLHPVRLGLTFTQEWMDSNGGSEAVMIFQFIRGMASIANAPLIFTSFVAGHVFESPQALFRIISTHYSSQLTKQVFGVLGSLAIFGAPADFISNVGNGVKDFLYEPLQGAVIGPREFLEGLEVGTQSLARGVFVGVVRGAANVTDAVNSNLVGLTADENFIDERKSHQRMLTDAMSRGASKRTFYDSLKLAYGSLSRGLKAGALGIVEQPAMYASKHGPVGLLKGIGKAVVGAVVKPLVGFGDGAVLVMNHMSDATSKKQMLPKIPKRLRRALPSRSSDNHLAVYLEPYDERAAKAQKIVTCAESNDDIYLGHVHISTHLVIASEKCLWAIDRRSREPWCVNWEDISHFSVLDDGLRIVVFSQTGLRTFLFPVENPSSLNKFHRLLSMQHKKMANASELNSVLSDTESDSLLRQRIPGVQSPQVNHIFGSCNNTRRRIGSTIKDEIDLVEQCHIRIRNMDSSSTTFFKALDIEAWSLISSWGQLFTGLNSRRCIVTSIINGTGIPIQIKSARLIEGGSPCYSLATKEYDTEQGVLNAGGAILFFGWGAVPNLLQVGNVYMQIETNGFVGEMADHKSSSTSATAMPGYQVGFLEKSYDDSGWWAKYWLLIRSDKHSLEE